MRREPKDYGQTTRLRRAGLLPSRSACVDDRSSSSRSLDKAATVAGDGERASVGDSSSSSSCFSAVMWTFLLTGVAVAGAMLWLHRDGVESGRQQERHRQQWLRSEEREQERVHARVTEA